MSRKVALEELLHHDVVLLALEQRFIMTFHASSTLALALATNYRATLLAGEQIHGDFLA